MDLRLRLALGSGFYPGANGIQPVGGGAPPLVSVNAEGWSAEWSGTPPSTLPMFGFTVQRQGFDATGAATTHDQTVTATIRRRLAYPDQATLTASTVCLSSTIYAGDVIAGVTNNSTLASPTPVCGWGLIHRMIVGNSLTVEVIALHRNGVAAVIITVADASAGTVTQTVSTSVESPETDANAVIVYRAVLDITSLAAGQITVNADVKPIFGDASSVLHSASSSDPDGFSPRYFTKNVALAAAPRIAYVSTVSGVAVGTISTDDAIAKATPWNAIGTLLAAAVTTYGAVDGLTIRLKSDSTGVGSWGAANRTQVLGGLTFEKELGYVGRQPWAWSTSQRTRINAPSSGISASGCLTLRGLNIQKTGTNIDGTTGTGTGSTVYQLVDCTLDGGNVLSAMFAGAYVRAHRCTIANATSSSLSGSTATVSLFFRGCDGDLTDTATLDNRFLVGNTFSRAPAPQKHSTKSQNGTLQVFNHWANIAAGAAFGLYANPDATPVTNVAILQNVFEFLRQTIQPGLIPSGDGLTYSTSGVIIAQNTVIGYDDKGRVNAFYDETVGTPRNHVLLVVRDNIFVCRAATKGDVFMQDGARRGNWPYNFGANVSGNLICSLTNFPHDFNGLQSVVSTGAFIDPVFIDNRGPTVSTDGTPGGNYGVQAASPAIGIVVSPLVPFDLNGVPRSLTAATAGAYEFV